MIARLIYARRPLGWPIQHWPEGVPSLWSHVGVLIGHSEVWEARAGHRFGPIHVDTFRSRYTETEIVEFDAPDLEGGARWLAGAAGKRYGMLTVLGRALGLTHGERSADHCSEAAENYLAACGLRRWRGDLHRVSPNQSYHNTCGVI